MNLEGFGNEYIARLDEDGKLENVAKFYSLKEDELIGLVLREEPHVYKNGREGKKKVTIQKTQAVKLLAAVESSRGRPLHRVILALGIPHVGESTAKDLARFFGSLSQLSSSTIETLLLIPNLGVQTAAAIRDFFASSRNQKVIIQLITALVTPAVPAVDRVSNISLQRFLSQLRIKGLGSVTLERVSDEFGDIETLVGAAASLPVGSPAELVAKELSTERWRRVLAQLRSLSISVTAAKRATAGKSGDDLRGRTIVITGTLDRMSREEAEALGESAGAKVAGSVSRNTYLLVAGEDPGPSKVAKAAQLGVRMIGEDEYFALLQRAGVWPAR